MTTNAAKKALAKQFVASLADLTGTQIRPLLTESATFSIMARSAGLPLPGEMTGGEYIDLMDEIAKLLPKGIQFEVTGCVIADGDHVAIEADGYADLGDGRAYSNAYFFLLKIKDGRIDSVREYTDYLHAKEALFPDPTASTTHAPA